MNEAAIVGQTGKLFGRDISMRSTFCNYDPCVGGQKWSVECDNCMVSLISDRFLGKKFAANILSKKYGSTRDLFTYVLIADTIGCNMNCWFCYAWKYIDPKDARKCSPHFLSAEELARQFDCKIRKTANLQYMRSKVESKAALKGNDKEKILRHLSKELPFSRIRISGGEPLFSNAQVFASSAASSEEDSLIERTIRYWVSFFERLDELVGRIKSENIISIATLDSEWQTLKHPVWLTEEVGRIMVRFDTNGSVFGNSKFCELFYSELFRLFKENKLNNLNVQLDYSFKGATAKEFQWSQKKGLPSSPDNNDESVNLESHPQVKGYLNVASNIAKYAKEDPGFARCVSITVEKGIDHDWEKSKLCLYYPGALKWEQLERLLGFQFSDVVNCFDLNFGWRLDAKVARYTNRGAVIEVTNGQERVTAPPATASKLADFRRSNYGKPGYMTLIYPMERGLQFSEERVAAPPLVQLIPSQEQNYWVITGNEENLRFGIQNGLWGVTRDSQDLWSNLKKDDFLFFYCPRPISGLVGFGTVLDRHEDAKPFWPNENTRAESRYPLRIKFQPVTVFKDWSSDKKAIYRTGIAFLHGLNYVEPEKRQVIRGKMDLESGLM